jgi:Tfp pilus assembly protein PilF
MGAQWRGDMLSALALVHRERREMAAADSLYRDACALQPSNGALWAAWGATLLEANEDRRACAVLARANSLEPGNAEIAFLYGVGLVRSHVAPEEGRSIIARSLRAGLVEPQRSLAMRLLAADVR